MSEGERTCLYDWRVENGMKVDRKGNENQFGRKALMDILKGFWIGSTMTVPGVSGGTMAVIVGLYEDLIHAVNGLRREPFRQIPFLLRFALGAGSGFLIFGGIVTYLLEQPATGEVMRMLFCGIVLGGIPLLVKKSEVKRVRVQHVFWLVCGTVIVLSLAAIPQGTFAGGEGMMAFLLQVAGGFLIAVALILPGISVTHMLYIMGLYELVMDSIYHFQFMVLVPLVIGGLLGTFLTTGLLERLMELQTEKVYLVMIGFVAGSLVSLFPQEGIRMLFPDLVALGLGFGVMYWLSGKAVEK